MNQLARASFSDPKENGGSVCGVWVETRRMGMLQVAKRKSSKLTRFATNAAELVCDCRSGRLWVGAPRRRDYLLSDYC